MYPDLDLCYITSPARSEPTYTQIIKSYLLEFGTLDGLSLEPSLYTEYFQDSFTKLASSNSGYDGSTTISEL